LNQLVAVARLHRDERRYNELRLEAWWSGLWVRPDQLRETLAGILDAGVADVRLVREQHPDPFDAAEAVVAQVVSPSRSRSPLTRLLLSRMRRDEPNMRTAVHAFYKFAFGGEPDWETLDVGLDQPEPWPVELVTQAMGLDRMASDNLDSGERLITERPDPREVLRQLRDADVLNFVRPGTVIRSASDLDLEVARIRARGFWDAFADTVELLEYHHGGDIAGLGGVTAARRRDWNWGRLFLVRYCLLLPRLANEDATDVFLKQIGSQRDKVAAALTVTKQFPGYKPFLTIGREERLAALPPEEREQVTETVHTYIESHPETRCLLDN
jgi:hypothetical protein